MPHQCTNCGRTFADGSKEMLSGCPDCSGTKFQFSPDGFDAGTTETPPDSLDPPDRPGDGVTRTVGNAAATVRDLVSGGAGPDATRATPPDRSTPPEGSSDTDSTGDDEEDIIVAESTPPAEDTAQTDARSEIAGPDDLSESGDLDPTTDDETDPVAGGGAPSATDAATGTVDSVDADSETIDQTDDETGTDAVARESQRDVATEPHTETADRPDLAQLREELNDQFESIRIVERGQYELNLMELYDRDEVIVALREDGRYSIRVPEAIGEADI